MLYTIDCEQLLDPEQAHEYLARTLGLPSYYGKNLDALYDCLTELGPCTIEMEGAEVLRQWGGFGGRVLAVFEQAAEGNRNITLFLDGLETM